MADNDADKKYIAFLVRQIDRAFDQKGLRILCRALELPCKNALGEDGNIEAHLLVSMALSSGYIDKLLAECTKRRPGLNWYTESKEKGLSRSLWRTSSKKEIQKSNGKRKTQRFLRKCQFLRSFFNSQSIAFEDDLCKSWELLLTWFLWKFNSQWVTKNITRLTTQTQKIHFSAQIENFVQNSPQSIAYRRQAFINYHSTRYWYRNLRANVSSFIVPLVVILLFSLLLNLLVVVGVLGMVPISSMNDVQNIAYMTPQSGWYYFKVQDTARQPHSYLVTISSPVSSTTVPDFSQSNVVPLNNNSHVVSSIKYNETHVYEIAARQNEIIGVFTYPFYSKDDIEFTLFDSQMVPCDQEIFTPGMYPLQQIFGCQVNSIAPYYLRIQIPYKENLSERMATLYASPVNYRFDMYQVQDLTENEPNDTPEESFKIAPFTAFYADTSIQDDDWYRFFVAGGTQLEIVGYGLTKSDASLYLYRQTKTDMELVAYSERGMPSNSNITIGDVLATSSGRVSVASYVLSLWGINISSDELRYSFAPLIVLLFEVFILLPIAIFYAVHIRYLSPKRFQESVVVNSLVAVLIKLNEEDVLRAEHKRGELRRLIRIAADNIKSLSKASLPGYYSAPSESDQLLIKIASQISHMNTLVSTPRTDTLSHLRKKFTEWFDVFLKSEYGSFRFESEFKFVPNMWYQSLIYRFQRYWIKYAIGIVLFTLVALLTQKYWITYLPEIADLIWFVVRYSILALGPYVIYMRWGHKDAKDTPVSKLQNAVLFLVFFVIPLLGFDTLLQTKIIDSFTKIVGSLKVW